MDRFICGICKFQCTKLELFVQHKESCPGPRNSISNASTEEGEINVDILRENPATQGSKNNQCATTRTAVQGNTKQIQPSQNLTLENVNSTCQISSTGCVTQEDKGVQCSLHFTISDEGGSIKDHVSQTEEGTSDDSEKLKGAAEIHHFQKRGSWWQHPVFICNLCQVFSNCKRKIETHCREVHDILLKHAITSITKCIPLDGEVCPKEKERTFGQPNREKPSGQDKSSLPGLNAVVSSVKRKRGRPRKSEQPSSKDTPVQVAADVCDSVSSSLKCDSCHRKFTRERQLRSHKCLTAFADEATNILPGSGTNSELMGDEGVVQVINSIVDQSSDVVIERIENLTGVNEVMDTEENMTESVDDVGKEHEVVQDMNENRISHCTSSYQSTLKLWTCPYCNKLFKFKYSLQVHIRSHTNTKPFKCSKCSYASTNKGNLTVHMQKHSGITLRCPQCSYTCFSKGHLKTHMKSHYIRERIICELCDRNLYAISNLIKHLEKIHDLSDSKNQEYYRKKKMECRLGQRILLYQCNICHRKFKNKKDHDVHVLLHQKKKPFCCPLCDYSCVKETYLKNHVKRHRYIYRCSECQEKFLSSILLREHLVNHYADVIDKSHIDNLFKESIECSIYLAEAVEEDIQEMNKRIIKPQVDGSRKQENIAVQNMENPRNLEGEIRGFPSQEKIVTDNISQMGKWFCKYDYKGMNLEFYHQLSKIYGQYECRYCGRFMYFKPSFMNHVKTHLEDKDFKCQECSYASHSKEGLKRHDEKVHRGIRYTCDKCGFVTFVKHYLQQHMRKHLRNKTLVCTLCQEKFTNEQTTKDHILERHPDITPYQLERIFGKRTHILNKPGKKWHACEYCGQEFRKVCKLRQHLWGHKGVNPYKCSICGHGSRTGSNLKTHMLKHSDVKNHLCDACGKAFKTKHALKVHNQVTHQQDGKFFCQECNYIGVEMSQLDQNMELHSGVKPYRCLVCENYTIDTKQELQLHYTNHHPSSKFDDAEIERLRLRSVLNRTEVHSVTTYQCTNCEHVFCNEHDLKLHLKRKHKVDVSSIQVISEVVNPGHAGSSNNDEVLQNVNHQVIEADTLDERNAISILQQLIHLHESSTASMTPTVLNVPAAADQQGKFAVLHGHTISTGNHVEIVHTSDQTQLVSLSGNKMQIVSIAGERHREILPDDGHSQVVPRGVETQKEKQAMADERFHVAAQLESSLEEIGNEDIEVHELDQGVPVQEEEVVTAAESIVATEITSTEAYVVDEGNQQLIVLTSSEW